MVNAFCGLLFASFCFCFIAFFQIDYLSFVQHYFSSGRNVTHDLTFAFIITIGLSALGLILQHYLHLPIRMRALNWIPSLYVLAIITSIDLGRYTPDYQTAGIGCFIVFGILYVIIYYVALRVHESRNENSPFLVLSWPNLLIFVFGFFFVSYTTNSNETLHRELSVERSLGEGDWDGVLSNQAYKSEPTRFMTAMSAYALCQKGELGDRFFYYANKEGSNGFLPLPYDSMRPWNLTRMYTELLGGFPMTDMNSTSYLEYISRDTVATTHVPVFLLTSYLLDRNLEDFTTKLLEYYPPADSVNHIYTQSDTLPANFREGLCLYLTQCQEQQDVVSSNAKIGLQDSLLFDRFHSYDSIRTFVHSPELKAQKLRDEYRGTYWYYYDYVK